MVPQSLIIDQKFSEDIHQEIINHCKNDGWSLSEIASHLEISEDKLSKYRKIDKKLEETLTLGQTHSKAWWERHGRKNIRTKDFQFCIWIAMLKNAYGWGDRPSERQFKAIGWEGGLEDKIKLMDQWLQEGKIAIEAYEHLMKSLHYHSQINELTYIKPHLERLDLERKLAEGQITKAQFDKEMELWEEARRAREIAIERILKSDKVVSKYMSKSSRRCKKREQ